MNDLQGMVEASETYSAQKKMHGPSPRGGWMRPREAEFSETINQAVEAMRTCPVTEDVVLHARRPAQLFAA